MTVFSSLAAGLARLAATAAPAADQGQESIAADPPHHVAVERHVREGRPGPARRRAGYIMDDDYPAAAIRAGAEGNVRVRFLIGTGGRVEACKIAESSGHAVLDSASCALVTRRFAYLPAISPHRRPVPEWRSQRIVWRLPAEPPSSTFIPDPVPPVPPPPPPGQPDPALERHLREARPGPARYRAGSIGPDDYPEAALRAGTQGVVVMLYLVGASGEVETCSVVQSSGNAELDTTSCGLITSRFRFLPAIGLDGRPTTEMRTQRVVWTLPDPLPQPAKTPGA